MDRNRTYKRQALVRLLIVAVIVVLVNVLSSAFFVRFDLTSDKRFSLADSTKKLLRSLDDVVFVKVYLSGEMPAGFKRLSTATREMLQEFKVCGRDRIQFEFEDPSKDKTEKELTDIYKELSEKGLQPTNVQTKGGDAYSEKIVVPGALVYFKGKEAPVELLENNTGVDPATLLNNSIAHLEYNLSLTIQRLSMSQPPKIGFIRGQGELDELSLANLFAGLGLFYRQEWVDVSDEIVIKEDFKTIVIAKPTTAFSEQDKFKIDQYIMNGGSVLWLVESLNAELDSIAKLGRVVTVDYPLNLEDQLFRYGIRINPDLILDLQCNPVPLLTSYEGQQPQFKLFPCWYFPVFTPTSDNLIVKNTGAIAAKFCSSIDTLVVKGVHKTILLHSSDKSRLVFTPWIIDFKELRNRPNPAEFNKSNLISGVLLEGKFPSAYRNRPTPEMLSTLRDSLKIIFRDESVHTKMIVIGDGDIARNETGPQGRPFSLGYYRYTGEYFGNKNFLLNSIDYLAGFEEHIATRSKTIKLRLLDAEKVKAEKIKWQLVNLLVPVVLLATFGVVFNFIRKRKFTH